MFRVWDAMRLQRVERERANEESANRVSSASKKPKGNTMLKCGRDQKKISKFFVHLF